MVSVGGWLQNMREQKERREKYTAPSNTFAKFSGELHHRRSRGPHPTPPRPNPVPHRTAPHRVLPAAAGFTAAGQRECCRGK